MEILQCRFLSPPALTLSRPKGRYKLDSNAVDKGVACILLQEQPKEPANPEGYWSQSLDKAE